MNNYIKGVIYDMDGLIINSEPLWKIAEIESFKEIGIDFTIKMCAQTTGMRIDEVVNFWWKKFKWNSPSQVDIINSIEEKMIHLITKNGKLLPGVLNSLKLLNEFSNLTVPALEPRSIQNSTFSSLPAVIYDSHWKILQS